MYFKRKNEKKMIDVSIFKFIRLVCVRLRTGVHDFQHYLCTTLSYARRTQIIIIKNLFFFFSFSRHLSSSAIFFIPVCYYLSVLMRRQHIGPVFLFSIIYLQLFFASPSSRRLFSK